MSEREDLVGQKFNRLTVISFSHKKHSAFWNCKCDCGNEKIIRGSHLKEGDTKSCGCLRREEQSKRAKTHGMEGTHIYKTWQSILQRCTNKNDNNYHNYGGRGITVCDRWRHSFENFYSDVGDRPEGLSIDRIDNNKGYSKDNCKWSTHREQQNNMRSNVYVTYNGKTQTMIQWTRELGMRANVLNSRINKYHWSIEKAITTPVEYRRARV